MDHGNSDSIKNKGYVKVVYVRKSNAKALKMALEQAQLLHKSFRMTKASNNAMEGGRGGEMIAIPVSDMFDRSAKDGSWLAYIETCGFQECPYSTSVLGNRSLVTYTKEEGDSQLTAVQQALVRTILSLGCEESQDEKQITEMVRNLGRVVCPKTLEIFGDDRTLVIPPLAFYGEDFESAISQWVDLPQFFENFWIQLASDYRSPRVVRRGTIDKESRIRRSGHKLVWPYSGIPEETGKLLFLLLLQRGWKGLEIWMKLIG